MDIQATQNSQNNLEKEEHSCRTHTAQFENLIQSYSNQGGGILHRDRRMGQWNRVEVPERNPYIYSKLPFGKSSKTIQ